MVLSREVVSIDFYGYGSEYVKFLELAFFELLVRISDVDNCLFYYELVILNFF